MTVSLPRCLKWFPTNRQAMKLHERGVWITMRIQWGFVKALKCHLSGYKDYVATVCKQFILTLNTCGVNRLLVACLGGMNFDFLIPSSYFYMCESTCQVTSK